MPQEEKLPFPTRKLVTKSGSVEEYVIPDERRREVLEKLYIFTPIPDLDDVVFDLHKGKKFRVGEFKVTWEDGQNYLVSPYYANSGGTVIDWMPEESAEQE